MLLFAPAGGAMCTRSAACYDSLCRAAAAGRIEAALLAAVQDKAEPAL
jgi:hypothetical protein